MANKIVQLKDKAGNDVFPVAAGSGIPTTATFWGASYDSTTNKVIGDIVADAGNSVWFDTSKNIGVSYADNRVLRIGRKSNGARLNFVSGYVGLVNGYFDMGNNKINNLANPIDARDAVTKNYVDSIYPVGAVFTSTSATAPTIAGGTWTEIGTQTIGSSTVHYYERTA